MTSLFNLCNGNRARAAGPAASVLIILTAGVLAALADATVPAGGLADARPRTPVLVELFTSEGCSSCPPADRLLESMIAAQPTPGAEIVGVGEHVDYWNHLGWKDRFSSTEFTSRQEAYGDRLGAGPSYTPQMVVDGVAAFVGSDARAARQAIEAAAAARHGRLQIDLSPLLDDELDLVVTASDLPLDKGDSADIVVAITEDGLRSDVRRGENAGKALTHAAVARWMRAIGQTNGSGGSAHSRLRLASDWNRDRLRVVAFAQARKSRSVLATAAVRPFAKAPSAGADGAARSR